MMVISIKEWDELPFPVQNFFHALSQEVFQIEPITDEIQEVFLCNKRNASIISLVDTILDAAEEAGIDEN